MDAVFLRAAAVAAAAVSQSQSAQTRSVRCTQVASMQLASKTKSAPTDLPLKDARRKSGNNQSATTFLVPLSRIIQIPEPFKHLWNFNNALNNSDVPLEDGTHSVAENPHSFAVNYGALDERMTESIEEELKVVTHTQESFAKFLRQVPFSELEDVAQACYLSNLAYVIRDIKADELHTFHHLRLISSSIACKDAAAARGKTPERVLNTAEDTGRDCVVGTPARAHALAAATRSEGCQPNVANEFMSRAVECQVSSAVASLMSSSPVAVPDEDDRHQEAAVSYSNNPCEWFVCDEQETGRRVFSIQGSESMASWQANLLFQPTQFEDPELGVMVHHGIYEAAKGLYAQMLPLVRSHMKAHGKRARISFTGHSLGGSLAVLLTLIFRYRGVIPVSSVEPAYTFGAPSVMSGGDSFLKHLGLPPTHIQSVVISRDLVPRIFSCEFPEHVVEVLKRVNGNFGKLSSFVHQRQLYSTMGQMMILQPEAQQAPGHPLLAPGSGLYRVEQPQELESKLPKLELSSMGNQVRAAEMAFLNNPHPLEIMSDPSAYGSGGAISRDHDPRSYRRAVTHVLKQSLQGLQCWKKLRKEEERELVWSSC